MANNIFFIVPILTLATFESLMSLLCDFTDLRINMKRIDLKKAYFLLIKVLNVLMNMFFFSDFSSSNIFQGYMYHRQ